MAEATNQRTRNWTFVIYPGDSAPTDWLDILKSLKTKGFVSPLHTDINPDDTEKKPHRHVLLMFEGKKSFNQVNEICQSLNAPHPQYVQSKSGMARYLCHLDNPEKKQYKPEDVICLGGSDYMETVATAADLDRTISEMEQWCDDNGVFSYAGLSRYARKNRPDWTRALRYRCTVHMKAYLQSCQWELKEGITYSFEEDEPVNHCSYCGSPEVVGGSAGDERETVMYCEDCRQTHEEMERIHEKE